MRKIISFNLLAGVGILTLFQVYIILQQLLHAFWIYYKFSGSGSISLSYTMLILALSISAASIIICSGIYFLNMNDKIIKIISSVIAAFLTYGIVILMLLLLSPMCNLKM